MRYLNMAVWAWLGMACSALAAPTGRATEHGPLDSSPRTSRARFVSDEAPAPESLESPAETTEEGLGLDERVAPLSQTRSDVALETANVPRDFAAERARQQQVLDGTNTSRLWYGTSCYWEPTRFCHRPLHFEEVNLERYGYSFGVAQPFVSAAAFFATVPILPYKIAADRPRCVYNLGYDRPGSRVPFRRQRLPWRPGAAVVQAGVVTGLVFIIP